MGQPSPPIVSAYDLYDLVQSRATFVGTDGITPADPSTVLFFTKSPADNFVIRVETGSARWLDAGPNSLPSTPTGGMGVPLLAGDGPIRLGPLAQINLLSAGIVHIQGYQGFFTL